MTFYLMSMKALVIFHHFQDIICRNLTQSWPWSLKLVKVKYKYTNQKPIHDFMFYGNNVCNTFHHFEDICCGNMHDLDFELCVYVKVKC